MKVLERLRSASGHAERAERGRAVMRVVRVQPNPPVGGAIVARDRIPERRRLPAERLYVELAAEGERRMHAIEAHARDARPAPEREELGGREGGGADRDGRERGDVERRRERESRPAQMDGVRRRRGTAQEAPELAEKARIGFGGHDRASFARPVPSTCADRPGPVSAVKLTCGGGLPVAPGAA